MNINVTEVIENITQDKKKLLLVIIALLFFLYVDFNYIIKSQAQGIKNIKPKIAQLKQDITSLEKDILKSKKGEFQQKQALGIKRTIPENNIPLFLQKISSIANNNKIKIMQMRPVKPKEAKDDKPASDSVSQNSIVINIDLAADYHGLGKFINELENGSELLSVEKIKIESIIDNYFQQNVNLEIRVYVQK